MCGYIYVYVCIDVQAAVMGLKSLRDLSDAPASKQETAALKVTCLEVPGIESVLDLKGRQSGPYLFVECTVGVFGELSASSAHRWVCRCRCRCGVRLGVRVMYVWV